MYNPADASVQSLAPTLYSLKRLGCSKRAPSSVFGELGIFLFSVFGAIALYFLLVSVTKKYLGKNLLLHGLFYALFGVLTSMFFYGRPHVFSYFLLFLELKFLYAFYENPSSKKVYWIPALAVLWSNLHGGFRILHIFFALFLSLQGCLLLTRGA